MFEGVPTKGHPHECYEMEAPSTKHAAEYSPATFVAKSLSVLDGEVLILQTISHLCAQGISREEATYFQQKVYPWMNPMILHVMQFIPDNVGVELLFWLLRNLLVPEELVQLLRKWAEGRWCPSDCEPRASEEGMPRQTSSQNQSSPPKGNAEGDKSIRKSALKASESEPTASPTRRAPFITPSGTMVQQDMYHSNVVEMTFEEKYEIVNKVPELRNLEQQDLETLCQAMDLNVFFDGEEVVKFGSVGSGMHIVVEGEARVSVPHEVGTLGESEVFGFQETLHSAPATESVEAHNGTLTTLHLDAIAFKAIGLKRKMGNLSRGRAARRRDDDQGFAVRRASSKKGTRNSSCEELQVSDVDYGLFYNAIRRNENLNAVLDMSDKMIEELSKFARLVQYKTDTLVFLKGDYGDAFYIVQDGVFEITNLSFMPGPSKNSRKAMGDSHKVRTGDTFGELALLYDAPRSASVTCIREGRLWEVTRTAIKAIMRSQTEGRIQEYAVLMESVELVRDLKPENRVALCDALQEMYFIRNETVVEQGTKAEMFYIIFSGVCTVLRDGVAEKELHRGDCFGEAALLSSDRMQETTLRVASDRCTVLVLDQFAYEMLLTPMYKERWSAAGDAAPSNFTNYTQKSLAVSAKMKRRLDKERFDSQTSEGSATLSVPRSCLECLGTLGKGAFGHVTLERDIRTGDLYALKKLSKARLVRERLKDAVVNEKACMDLLDSAFVVRLIGTYRDQASIFFLIEACLGGDLFELYEQRANLFGSEDHARFYAACVALGLEHMHSRRIVYRDLKLENCMLRSSGYCVLTDMGVAKVVIGKTYTVCGTADYFAPETLRQTGHNRAVDWWALGVLIYVMMSGRTPFDAPDSMSIYKKIIKGVAKVHFPNDFSEACVSMICGLCQKKPEERLTMGSLGVQNYKDHPWYRQFHWNELESSVLSAPEQLSVSIDEVVEKARQRHAQEDSDDDEAIEDLSCDDLDDTWDEIFEEAIYLRRRGSLVRKMDN